MKLFWSNTFLWVVLLFVSAIQASAWDIKEKCDTIILDGEIIYIEPKDVTLDIDSLQEQMSADIIKPRQNGHFSLTFLGGFTHQTVEISSELTGFETLDEFTGRSKRTQVDPSIGLELSMKLHKGISAVIGCFVSSTSASWSYVDPNSIAPDEQRFRFEFRSDQLWQYISFPVGPGFETDTIDIPLKSFRIRGQRFGIPVGLRYGFLPDNSKRKWVPFIDAGVSFHLTRWKGSGLPSGRNMYLLNESGAYLTVPASELNSPDVSVRPYVAIGTWWHWKKGWSLSARYSPGLVRNRVASSDRLKMTGYDGSFVIGITHFFP